MNYQSNEKATSCFISSSYGFIGADSNIKWNYS